MSRIRYRAYAPLARGPTPRRVATPGPTLNPTRAHLRLTPTPALVAHAQGGLTLGPEQGELDADFCHLGTRKVLTPETPWHQKSADIKKALRTHPYPVINK